MKAEYFYSAYKIYCLIARMSGIKKNTIIIQTTENYIKFRNPKMSLSIPYAKANSIIPSLLYAIETFYYITIPNKASKIKVFTKYAKKNKFKFKTH